MFAIEDEAHADRHEHYQTLQEAIAELGRLSKIPWDKEPNLPPCTNWRKCGRRYEIVEYDVSVRPWKELSRDLVLTVSASSVEWLPFPKANN